jgi:hypothetical protein
MQVKTILLWVVVFLILYFLIRYLTVSNTLTSLSNAQTMQTLTLPANNSNQPAGNFCYSLWVYVQDWSYRYGEQKVLFTRASAPPDTSDPDTGSPLVFLDKYQNNLFVVVNTYSPSDSSRKSNSICMVENLPVQKWVHIYISVYQRELDVYLDGKLVRTMLMDNIAQPKDSEQVYVTPAGGFSGWTSKFQYFNQAGNPQQAWNLYRAGYGGSVFGNLFGNYHVKIALQSGDTENKSFTF